jgi:hypothetical protein
MIFIITLFFLKHTKATSFVVLLFFFFKISCINTFILVISNYLVLVNFLKNNLILKLIHIFCIFFFLVTQQQIYIFYLELVETIINYIEVVKVNNISLKIKTYAVGFDSLNLITYINQDSYICGFDLLSGLDKNTFEKSVLFTNNNLTELYSYNFQKLIQVSGFNIFLFLVLLGILVLLLLREKKNIFI